jgi:hypothetical protein
LQRYCRGDRIAVDDAIAVAENVERQLEPGLSPIAAAVTAMPEEPGVISRYPGAGRNSLRVCAPSIEAPLALQEHLDRLFNCVLGSVPNPSFVPDARWPSATCVRGFIRGDAVWRRPDEVRDTAAGLGGLRALTLSLTVRPVTT